MRRVLLMSDSHGKLSSDVMQHAAMADEVWHAGDWGSMEPYQQLESLRKEIRGVTGNIDGQTIRSIVPLKHVFFCEQLKVCMTHIGGYPGRYAKNIADWLRQEKPDLFISGHSHILKIVRDPAIPCLHMNPGACGSHGFHHVRTLIRFQVTHKTISALEVIELGPRTEQI